MMMILEGYFIIHIMIRVSSTCVNYEPNKAIDMEHEHSDRSSYKPEFDSLGQQEGHEFGQQVDDGEGHDFGPQVDAGEGYDVNPFLDHPSIFQEHDHPSIDDDQIDGLVKDDSDLECEDNDGEDDGYMVDKTHEMEEIC
ncbi:hypothetical protein L6452_32366 [Arctium lappa]|uniref:Uncharacterized protein n=1 Tax=Arctium lappa TaxID=4217 RepID=A0ACB8Z3I1_ARCLA|nr:hypothetical protein L6452_32366 [Arctium lappa]